MRWLYKSKADGRQVHDLQFDALIVAGVDPKRIYQDSISGARDCRRGLNAGLDALVPGDTLVIWKLDRLGRSLRHLVNTVGGLTACGIGRRFKNDIERLESCWSSTSG